MAHQIRIDAVENFAYVFLYDEISGKELPGIISELALNPEWKPDTSTLWDATTITKFVIDPSDIYLIRDRVSSFLDQRGPGKTAFAARREMDVTVAALFKVLLRIPGREIRVFRTVEEAVDWIGVENLPE